MGVVPKFLLRGREFREYVPQVFKGGTSSVIYLPKSWGGKKVTVVLHDDKKDEGGH